jgi:hypothetical protein
LSDTKREYGFLSRFRNAMAGTPEREDPMSITGRAYDVFISYAHRDGQETAEYLDLELRRAGLRTFRDTTDLLVGELMLDRLSRAMSESSYFLMVMTPAYFESGWCRQEVFEYLTSKLDSRQGAVLPILAKSCEPPPFIRPYKWIDLSRTSVEDCAGQIVSRIRADLPQDRPLALPSKFPGWVDEACEIGSLARRSATHILR